MNQSGEIIKTGWLEKRGFLTIWFPRYVVLKFCNGKPVIHYYSDDKSEDPRGIIDIECSVALPCDTSMGRPFSFKIAHPHTDCFYFQAPNKAEQEAWLIDITKCIEGKSSLEDRNFFKVERVVPVVINISQKDIESDWVDLGGELVGDQNTVTIDMNDTNNKKLKIKENTAKSASKPNKINNIQAKSKKLYNDNIFSSERLENLFHEYKKKIEVRVDSDEDSSEEEEYINSSGLARFLKDVDIDPEDVSLLVFSYRIQAKEMGIYTREEFIAGMTKLKLDSTKKVAEALKSMKKQLFENKELFREVYKYAFTFSLEKDSRIISVDVALFLSDMLMPGDSHNHATQWREFLRNNTQRKSINSDTWNLFLDFSFKVKLDFSNFDPDEYPPLLEDFVEWAQEQKK